MTDKEYIIIGGKKKDCKILFRCKHIDDTAAYDMMCERIEIKPENASVSVSDLELMLIENTESPFGFSFVCKRNNKEDVWEYNGFGNSGACSIVTALLKQLGRKTQIIDDVEEVIKPYQEQIELDALSLPIAIESILERKTQECEELKEENKVLQKLVSELEYSTQTGIELNDRYRKALKEIGKVIKINCEEICGRKFADCNDFLCTSKNILDIINNAKGEECN